MNKQQCDARAVLSDWLEERDLPQPSSDTLEQALKRANGRRRTRTVDTSDVEWRARKLDENGHDAELELGGTVANSYKYPAVQTAVLVYSLGPWKLAIVREASAKGGTGFGDLVRRNRDTDAATWIGGGLDMELLRALLPKSVLVIPGDE